MKVSQISTNDVIMVVIEGTAVPCEVLDIESPPPDEPSASPTLRLLDLGANRVFFRTAESLESCRRFNGQVTTLVGYSDYLRHNEPDVTVHFLPPPGGRKSSVVGVTLRHPKRTLGDKFTEGVTAALQGKSPAEITEIIAQLTEVYNKSQENPVQ